MSRKTHRVSAAVIAAGIALTLSNAELSGAFAQVTDQGTQTEDQAQAAENAQNPIFVSNEVVQPVDESQTHSDNADNAAPAASLRELVAQTDSDYQLSEQMRCLAGAIYFESRGEPLAGQLAVAQVIINRSESHQFPSSYCGVVTQRSQFSFVKNGRLPQPRTGSEAWSRAKAVARIAHEGMWDSEAGDSLYFHAKYVRPSWSRKKVARATISSHVFYR